MLQGHAMVGVDNTSHKEEPDPTTDHDSTEAVARRMEAALANDLGVEHKVVWVHDRTDLVNHLLPPKYVPHVGCRLRRKRRFSPLSSAQVRLGIVPLLTV